MPAWRIACIRPVLPDALRSAAIALSDGRFAL
jgi:hypothetical protein